MRVATLHSGLLGAIFLIFSGTGLHAQENQPTTLDANSGPVFLKALKDEAPEMNAGLFVGINEFREDDGIDRLDYAVNDAVDLAHLFALELKLIPAKRCFLCLTGSPAGNEATAHLEALREAGAQVSEAASKAAILKSANRLAELTFDKEQSLIVASLSTHGMFHQGIPYVIPTDGVRDDLAETALKLTYLEEKIASTQAGHRVLFIDACQERISVKATGSGDARAAMSPAFFEALKSKTGQAKLASCSPGEFSFEHFSLKHGVFTHFLLESFRGSAAPDKDGLVRLEAVINATRDGINAWGSRTKRKQTVFYAGPDEARLLPLAERADDAVALAAQLKNRVSTKDGGFSQETCDLLLKYLPKLKPDSETDRKLIGDIRDFAGGRLREDVFVLILKDRVPDLGSPPTPPVKPALLMAPFGRDDVAASRAAWAKYLGQPETIKNSIGMEFVLVPPGEFEMGAIGIPGLVDDEHPVHRVRITKPLYVGKHEVTRGQYREFVKVTGHKTEAEADGQGGWGWNDTTLTFEGRNPQYTWQNTGFRQTDSHPVANVTWSDAKKFSDWLTRSNNDAMTYRLPTEAEWEYACRAGTTGRWFLGDDPQDLVRSGNVADSTAKAHWTNHQTFVYVDASDGHAFTAPVGTFNSNSFELCDLHGNVWEWCEDWYDPRQYSKNRIRTALDPQGTPAERKFRVIRGGSWGLGYLDTRSANRFRDEPTGRSSNLGFRVVFVPTTP